MQNLCLTVKVSAQQSLLKVLLRPAKLVLEAVADLKRPYPMLMATDIMPISLLKTAPLALQRLNQCQDTFLDGFSKYLKKMSRASI